LVRRWFAVLAFILPLVSVDLATAVEPLQVKVAGCRPGNAGEFSKGYQGRGYSNAAEDQEVEMLLAYHTASPDDDPEEALEEIKSIEVCIAEGDADDPSISCPASSDSDWYVYHENGSGAFSTIDLSWIKDTSDPIKGLYAEEDSVFTFPYLWAEESEVAFFLKVKHKDGSKWEGEESITELGGCSGAFRCVRVIRATATAS
jgi:hypothetical protein